MAIVRFSLYAEDKYIPARIRNCFETILAGEEKHIYEIKSHLIAQAKIIEDLNKQIGALNDLIQKQGVASTAFQLSGTVFFAMISFLIGSLLF